MAVLTDRSIQRAWQRMFRKGQGKAELKADAGGMPDRGTRRDIFQAIEDRWEVVLNSIEAQMNSAAGRTLPAEVARLYIKQWLLDKSERT